MGIAWLNDGESPAPPGGPDRIFLRPVVRRVYLLLFPLQRSHYCAADHLRGRAVERVVPRVANVSTLRRAETATVVRVFLKCRADF
jgi:hypothetical protein